MPGDFGSSVARALLCLMASARFDNRCISMNADASQSLAKIYLGTLVIRLQASGDKGQECISHVIPLLSPRTDANEGVTSADLATSSRRAIRGNSMKPKKFGLAPRSLDVLTTMSLMQGPRLPRPLI
jgi:hypothetical protein